MEQREQRDEGGDEDRRVVYGSQMGGMVGKGRQQEWPEAERDRTMEGEYREMVGVRGDGHEASQSEGTEEDDDDGDMVEGEVEGGGAPNERGTEGGDGVVGPLLHTQMGTFDPEQVRLDTSMPSRTSDGVFERAAADRERGALKAVVGGNSGMFHSPSSTLPFLNSFSSSLSSPQLGVGHSDTNPAQNGGRGLAASHTSSRDGMMRESGMSREASKEGFRANVAVGSLQEQARITQGSLHEQLQSSAVSDPDNYYTSLLNSQISNSNVLKGTDSPNDPSARHRTLDSLSSVAESSLRHILSDPLTGALLEDAMIISCGHSVGNAGLRRVMDTNVCITCGASVHTESMAPNYALRSAVQAYKREEEMMSHVKSAKRRRDPTQDGLGPPDQSASDPTRTKGVQFPFVVSDRVMIKGNKRTPERFVGREAVITTQCLMAGTWCGHWTTERVYGCNIAPYKKWEDHGWGMNHL